VFTRLLLGFCRFYYGLLSVFLILRCFTSCYSVLLRIYYFSSGFTNVLLCFTKCLLAVY